MMGLATLLAKVGSTLRAVFRRTERPDHYLRERYGIEEKPEGWNDAVLGYFHSGPELREKGEDYRAAFAARAARHSPVDDDLDSPDRAA